MTGIAHHKTVDNIDIYDTIILVYSTQSILLKGRIAMMTFRDLPLYTPGLLNLHIIQGISYEEAKKLAETYGVIVLSHNNIWDRLSILQVQIPHQDSLDEWIKKLEVEIAFFRITKIFSSSMPSSATA